MTSVDGAVESLDLPLIEFHDSLLKNILSVTTERTPNYSYTAFDKQVIFRSQVLGPKSLIDDKLSSKSSG